MTVGSLTIVFTVGLVEMASASIQGPGFLNLVCFSTSMGSASLHLVVTHPSQPPLVGPGCATLLINKPEQIHMSDVVMDWIAPKPSAVVNVEVCKTQGLLQLNVWRLSVHYRMRLLLFWPHWLLYIKLPAALLLVSAAASALYLIHMRLWRAVPLLRTAVSSHCVH